MVAIRPIRDQIFVKRLTFEEKSIIVIPDSVKEKSLFGEVIAVGPGRVTRKGKRIKVDLKPGDKIVFGKYSGTEVKINKRDYLIMRESEVFGILEEEGDGRRLENKN
ncbi:MAG: co-chaperone GroES [Deltaproteobacteria bacterium]|nr:MAG: co-chaperone GroES [Deltaproteobacteria bacterium]